MRTPQRSTLASFALKTLTGAIASAVFVTSAYAAGLGKLTVHSALGQPLNAEIELTSVSSEEASGLVAKLASPDAFRLANIEFNPALMSLRFNVEQRGNRQFIKITSAQPLNEPFVDMLLELSWSNGRLVREYTFLLDPAEMRTAQAPQVAAAEAPARAAAQTDSQARTAPRPAQRAAPARQDSEQPARDAVSEYKVKSGDTLGKIARTVKPVDISLDMMLVALYRANPEAFSGNNMNRLKSGRILAVPDSEAIKGSTNAGEARGVVVAHAADFTAYRNKLAGQVATAAPDRGRSNTQSAAGKITAQVKEQPTAASEAQDKLRLSKAQADSDAAAGAAGAPLSAEEKIAKDRALADATARVKELERNVTDLENLMAVKSKAGSDAAKPADAAPPDAPAAKAPATPAAGAPVEVLEAKPAVPPPPKKVRKPAPSEPTFADTVMDNATSIALGVGAVLLGLLGISALRRRKAAAEQPAAPSEPSVLGAPSEQAHSLFAETGGQSVDTNNSVFNSSFAPSASQLDTNEVDPVAEADVYIAYGRDAQAEEILKEALRTHPERMPVRLKLLEIYAARKDLRAFETQASEVYGITRGHGDDWAQAAMLGVALDPNNPLYASAAHAAPMAHSPTAEELGQQVMLSNQLDDPLTATPAPADDEIEHIDLTDARGREQAMDLDLDLATDAAALPRTPSAPAADQDQSLDFDLGGLSFEPQPAAAPARAAADDDHVLDFSVPDTVTPVPVAPVTAPIAEPEPALAAGADDERFDMAFDMGFDEPAQEGAAPEVSHARALDDISLDLPGVATPGAVGNVDLSKDFGLPPLPETPAPAAADHVAHPLSDLDAMDFDLPPPADQQPAAASAPLEDQTDDDLYTLDLPGATPADVTPPQFDMASIDLDLPPTDNEPLSPLDDSPTALPDLDGLDNLEQQAAGAEAEALSAVHMEMETKLDLAVAYQEIGDKEGARELLDEVIKGGSPEQVGRANEMRAKLA